MPFYKDTVMWMSGSHTGDLVFVLRLLKLLKQACAEMHDGARDVLSMLLGHHICNLSLLGSSQVPMVFLLAQLPPSCSF